MILNELYKLTELSPDTLASYKKAAGADATAADAAGDYARGNKRFKGIVQATKKEFANDKKKKGVAEGSGGNWYIRVNGKILNDTKFKPMIFSSEDEARSYAMKLADKKRIPLSQIKLTKSWMDAPEQGMAEGAPELLKKEMPLHRHAEKLLAQNGVSKDDPDYHHHLGNTIKYLRQFGNIDLINKSDEQGVAEGHNNSRTIIAEALITERLWSTAGRKLMEAQLTADQITQIFQQIQQDATAAGGNRTLIGKGKDAADAVSSAWTNLKDKIYNSKPMSNFASAYDTAAEKLKQATGGDTGAMKYIQKYRDFATKHPMLQSAIYAALIAASGISGVGLAGAAALGLFKLFDQAIQGKDIRSAMWSGVKTGAQAFAAGQIGQALKGQPAGGGGGGAEDYYMQSRSGDFSNVPDTPIDGSTRIISDLGPLKSMAGDPNLSPVAQKLAADLAAGKNVEGAGEYLRKAMQGAAQKASMMGDMPDGSANAGMRQFMSLQNLFKAVDDAGLATTLKESVTLSESQLFFVIGKIVERHRKLDEGLMDTIKGAAGKAVGSVVNYARTKGTNLTTKITADKLLQAWKKAGSPMDSATVAKVIQDAGVPATSVQQAYSTMKIPFDAAPAAPAAPATAPVAAAPAAPAAPAAAAGKFPGEDPQGAGYVGRREVARRQAARAAGATKPAPAKTPSFGGPTGYSSQNTTIKQPAKQPAVAEAGLNEFAPGAGGDDDGNDGFSDDTLRQLAAQWYNGDEDPKVEQTLMAAGWEIGQDEGYDDTPGVFVVKTGDVNGNSYISWPAEELEVLSESAGNELQSILKSAGLVHNR